MWLWDFNVRIHLLLNKLHLRHVNHPNSNHSPRVRITLMIPLISEYFQECRVRLTREEGKRFNFASLPMWISRSSQFQRSVRSYFSCQNSWILGSLIVSQTENGNSIFVPFTANSMRISWSLQDYSLIGWGNSNYLGWVQRNEAGINQTCFIMSISSPVCFVVIY